MENDGNIHRKHIKQRKQKDMNKERLNKKNARKNK